jgi:thiamine biosynthesis protein ThiS
VLEIIVNGEKRVLDARLTLAELVQQLGLTPARIALELNREVVRRAAWQDIQIGDGDSLEIVHFVGGG